MVGRHLQSDRLGEDACLLLLSFAMTDGTLMMRTEGFSSAVLSTMATDFVDAGLVRIPMEKYTLCFWR